MSNRSTASQGRTPAVHKAYLEAAFGPWSDAAVDLVRMEYGLASCRDLIGAGIRVEGGVDSTYAVRTLWRHPAAMRTLFAEYVARGLAEINSDANGGLPIEKAIVSGNLQALELFLHHGADVSLVPSSAWLQAREQRLAGVGAPRPKKPEQTISDVVEFARRHCRVKAAKPAILAILRAAEMTRQIDETVASHAGEMTAESPNSSRNKRKSRTL